MSRPWQSWSLNRADRLAAGLLLAGVPLVYAPLTVELLPQKALVFALALPFIGRRGSRLAAGALLVGAAIASIRPQTPWEILALAAAPAAWGVLRRTGVQANARTITIAAWILCALAGLQLLGVDPFGGSTRAFDLDYAVLTATLGNPNHLGAWLVLAAPFVTGPTLAAIAVTTALTRSSLAIGALALHLILRAHWRWQRLALAGALACGIAYKAQPLARTAEARVRLAGEFGQLLDARTVITGVGPGSLRASYMARHPGTLEDPRHPHNDPLRLVLVWGLPVCAALGLGLLFRLRGPPRWDAWLPAAALALGATVIGDPATWALILAHAARDFAPARPTCATSRFVPPLAAAFIVLCTLWCAEGVSQRRVLGAMAAGEPLPAADVERVRSWPFDPVLSAWLTEEGGAGR